MILQIHVYDLPRHSKYNVTLFSQNIEIFIKIFIKSTCVINYVQLSN